MELSFLLMQQILKLFIMVVVGYVIVKAKLFKVEDSKIMSKFVLYVASPCAILSSYQVSFSNEKLHGLFIALIGALVVQIAFIIGARFLNNFREFQSIEKAAMIYANSGNLIIPLVGSVLGTQWVIYSSGYMLIQTILLWTHAKSLVMESPSYEFKKIVLNINVIAIVIGFAMFMSKITLPSILGETVSSFGSMIGPLSMIIVGMLIANMNLSEVFANKRAYVICFYRLIVFPLFAVALLKVTDIFFFGSNGNEIFIITLLAASAPTASTITNFAQIFDKDPAYSSIINVLSVIFCLITMPLIIMFYQII